MKFLLPYIKFLYGAAYSTQQTLEGYGITSSNFVERDSVGKIVGNYWSPDEAVLIPFTALLVYCFLLFFSLIVSGFVLGKWKGVLVSILFITFPGILSVIGFWPQINYLPHVYFMSGSGDLGSPKGVLPLLLLGLATGWSLIVNVYDTFRLNDKFRNYFDHFWYCSAILAGVFFVSDSGSNNNHKMLQKENQVSRESSFYLLNQVQAYDSFCHEQHIDHKVSCRWASDVQQILNDYATYDEKLFYQVGPKTTLEIYNPIERNIHKQKILKIRQEIKFYNESKCPSKRINRDIVKHSRPSGKCQTVPGKFCASFPEPPDDIADKYIAGHTVALASECIIPSLVISRKRQEKYQTIDNENSKVKHERWLFYVLFSIIAGGKIANASTKVFELDKRVGSDKQRIIELLITMLSYTKCLLVWLLNAINAGFRRL